MKTLLWLVVLCCAVGFAIHEVGTHQSSKGAGDAQEDVSMLGPAPNTSEAVVNKQFGYIPALALFMSYQSNEVAADNSFRGRRFITRGVVASVRKNLADDVVVALRTPNEFMNIQGKMTRESAGQAALLHENDNISLLCTGAGMIIGSPMLNDCSFYHSPEPQTPQSVTPISDPASPVVPQAEAQSKSELTTASDSLNISSRQDLITSPAVVLSMQDPEYTDEARMNKLNGNVLVSCEIGIDGKPADITVIRSLGMGLDEKAAEAVSRYKFRPAMKNGEPVAQAMEIEVKFQLF